MKITKKRNLNRRNNNNKIIKNRLITKKTKIKKINKSRIKKSKHFRKQKQNQHGGKKLGEGSFGCVVTPPLNCNKKNSVNKNSDSTKYVSKLISIKDKYDYDDIKQELYMNKLLYKIDPDNEYFTTIIDGCILKQTNNNRKDIKFVNKKKSEKKSNKCVLLKKKKNMNLIMRNAGLNLDDIIIYKNKYIDEKKLLKKHYVDIFYHLLIGLEKIHDADLTHHDIKPDNFAVNIKNEIPKVTYLDFGIMEENSSYLNNNNLNNYSTSVYGTPGYIAPDMYVLTSIVYYLSKYSINELLNPRIMKKITNNILREIIQNEIHYHYTFNLNLVTLEYPKATIKKTFLKNNNYYLINKNTIDKIYQFIIVNIKNNKLNKLFAKKNGLSHKYDIYALGVTFFNISKNLNINNKDLSDLLRSMIEPLPYKRYDIEDCLNHPFFKKINKSKKKSTNKHSKSKN